LRRTACINAVMVIPPCASMLLIVAARPGRRHTLVYRVE
jgi:hypothetical protein